MNFYDSFCIGITVSLLDMLDMVPWSIGQKILWNLLILSLLSAPLVLVFGFCPFFNEKLYSSLKS